MIMIKLGNYKDLVSTHLKRSQHDFAIQDYKRYRSFSESSPIQRRQSLILRSVSDPCESCIVVQDFTLDRYLHTYLSTLSSLEVDNVLCLLCPQSHRMQGYQLAASPPCSHGHYSRHKPTPSLLFLAACVLCHE